MTKTVHRIEDGMDRHDVDATTYQMRNFYRQMGDGFFSVLDTMNYIQHQFIVRQCKPGDRVLDVCCGRGLLLPMMRYERKTIAGYVGVDIEPGNAKFLEQRVTDGKPIEPGYYPFPVQFVSGNVAQLSQIVEGKFDVIVYTSSIEHMHPKHGQKSLVECRRVIAPGGRLIITCPNTPEDQDGYNTQYRAHIYEWKRSELIMGLKKAGFKVVKEWGLLIDKRTLHSQAKRYHFEQLLEQVEQFIPSEWLLPIFAPMFPRESKEIGFIAEAV